MAQADGTVYINTAIEADGMQAGSKQVEAACRRMAKTVNGIGEAAKLSLQKQLDAFAKQNQMYDRQAQKVQEIESRLKEMSEQKVETAEYKAATKEVEKLDAALLKAYDRKERFLDTGGSESGRGFQGILHDIEVLETRLRMATAEKERLETSGGAYQAADTSALEDKYIAESQRLEQMHNSLGTSYEALKQKLASYGAELGEVMKMMGPVQSTLWGLATALKAVIKIPISMLKTAFQGIYSVLKMVVSQAWKAAAALAQMVGKGIVGGLKKLTAGIFGLSKATKKSSGSFGSSLKTILKYTLGIRSLFVLFNRARAAIKEGFGNLAQYSAPVNASISSLMSALTQLKNSLATAFAPILNVVAPILTTFINLVSRAVTAVGMLIATLTGAKSFTRATAVQQDYAASLEGSAGAAKDAAKEQQKYLSGLDEVRTFTEESDSSGGGGGGAGGLNPSDMFEEVEIPSKFGDIAQMIKDAWAKADFTEIGTLIGTKLSGALDLIPWDNIQSKCNRVAQSIGTFINGFVATPGLWQKVGYTIGQGINTAVGMWNTFFDTTKFQPIGEAIATAANNAVTTIDANGLGRAISQKLQAGIEIAYGFVTTFDWSKFGTQAAASLNSAFHNVDFSMAGQTLSAGIIGVLNSMTAAIQNFDWNGLGNRISQFLQNIDWAGISSSLFTLLGSILGGLGQFFIGLFEDAVSSISNWWNTEAFTEEGQFTLEGLFNGILNALENVGTWIKDHIFTPFINGFKKAFGINSPSTVMAEQGRYLMEGLYNGITNWISNIGEAFTRIKDTVVNKWNEVKQKTTEAWNAIKSTISQKWNEIKSSISTAATNVKSTLSTAWSNIKSAASSSWSNIKSTISTAWSNLKSDASSKWSSIKNTISSATSSMRSTASSAASNLRSTFTNAFSSIASSAQSAFDRVRSALSSLWNTVKQKASQISDRLSSAASGISYSATPNSKPIMPVPAAPTPKIPYLASGAVIPPRAAFLAVLGDQRNGNNLEMPESLLRKVVREESGSRGFSGTLRIPLYINGRQVMEAVLEEAQLKQMISGRNPFEMA